MKRIVLGFGALVVGFLFVGYGLTEVFPPSNNPKVELEIRNRVVRINIITEKYTAGCTGTFLSHNYILTNAHCVPEGLKPQVFIRHINDSDFTEAIIVSSAPKTDYALLSFKGLDTSTQVDFTKDWSIGEDIILYGNPGDHDFVVGHSKIVGYIYVRTPLHKLRKMFVYPCNESAPGFSGSGVYNLKGEYIGTHELGQEIPISYQIATRLAGEPRQGPMCYAIPAKEAMERNLDRPWYGFNMEDK